jgi:3-methyladenine DNA glycosylase AlkD
MNEIIEKVRRALREASDEKTRETGERYFKEPVTMYGIRANDVRNIARDNYTLVKSHPKELILSLCDSLWASGMMEECAVACLWSEKIVGKMVPGDFNLLSKWIHDYVTNWASCDTLCNHTVGDFIQKYPEYLTELRKWARSENRWVKRASAVSLIIPARKGKFLEEILEIADILLLDRDDMVQKGYGWMLKAASQAHQEEVFDFVMHHKAVMPRTALRYAIEKMPPALRAKAMEK